VYRSGREDLEAVVKPQKEDVSPPLLIWHVRWRLVVFFIFKLLAKNIRKIVLVMIAVNKYYC
jgi:hypothetical protein